MRIGIIGGGVSGMAAAWLLQHDHQVVLFERAARLGGHVETVPVEIDGRTIHAELGPRFFFDTAYPYFLGLLRLLAIPVHWNDARIAITDRSRGHTIVLPPRSPRQVVSLLRSPRLVRHVLSLRRLIEEQSAIASRRDFACTFRQHLAQRRYPESFGPEFAFRFLAACWGAPLDQLPDFPVYSLLKGMPSGKKPGFYEVQGGMARYIKALGDEVTQVELRLGAGIRRVYQGRIGKGALRSHSLAFPNPLPEPHPHDGFDVEDDRGERHHVDRLIVATSSRDGASLLRGLPGATEMHSLVARFRHFDTETVIHGDTSFMPPHRGDWSHNNFVVDGNAPWMTDWQGLREGVPVFRSWVPKGHALPQPMYARRAYHHLVMTPENAVLQQRIAAQQGTIGLWVTGMYAVDVDNHESALLSALPPAMALAPRSKNLQRLLASVARDAPHGLEVLPVPLTSPVREDGSALQAPTS